MTNLSCRHCDYLAGTFLLPLQTSAHSGHSGHMWGGNAYLQPVENEMFYFFNIYPINPNSDKLINWDKSTEKLCYMRQNSAGIIVLYYNKYKYILFSTYKKQFESKSK